MGCGHRALCCVCGIVRKTRTTENTEAFLGKGEWRGGGREGEVRGGQLTFQKPMVKRVPKYHC